MKDEIYKAFSNLRNLDESIFTLYELTKDERLKQFDKPLQKLNDLFVELDLKRIENE